MKATIAVVAALAAIMASAHQTQATELFGDFNDDGFVGQLDLDIVLADWEDPGVGREPREPEYPRTVSQEALDTVLSCWAMGTPVPLTPRAGIRLSIAPVDNSSALSGWVTQDLVILTHTDWLGAQLMVTPDEPGHIYQDPDEGTQYAQSPNPAFFDTFPSLEFDTYVSSGQLGHRVHMVSAADLVAGGPWAGFDEDALGPAWFTIDTDDLGELALARITLAEDATGTWSFLATAVPAEGPMVLAEGSIVDGAMVFAGDLNGDGFVGQSDLDIVLGRWGQNAAAGAGSDPSADGFVGQADLDIVLTHWGIGSPSAAPAPVPEPATLSLLGLASLSVIRRRRLPTK